MNQSLVPLSRYAVFADLTVREQAALRGLGQDRVDYPRDTVIVSEGESPPRMLLLHSGWTATGIGLPNGKQQLIKIYMPGDMMGVASLALQSAAETIVSLTPVTVSRVPLRLLADIFTELPRLAMLFYLLAQEERVILMDRLTAVGRRTALQRVAALLLHLFDRMRLIDPNQAPSLTVPLTQEQIGDFLGLTAVHVNRVLRALEEDGLIRRVRKQIDLADYAALQQLVALPPRIAARNPGWLPQPL